MTPGIQISTSLSLLMVCTFVYFDADDDRILVMQPCLPTALCPEYLYTSCEMPEQMFGKYYLFTSGDDTFLQIHREGIILGQGEEGLCYEQQPGTDNEIEGSPGVMSSIQVVVRWDDPAKKWGTCLWVKGLHLGSHCWYTYIWMRMNGVQAVSHIKFFGSSS